MHLITLLITESKFLLIVADPRTLSYSKNFVTPAADLPQKKIVHVHARQGGLTQAVLTALNTAEGEGDLKSLVIPARPTGTVVCISILVITCIHCQRINKLDTLANIEMRFALSLNEGQSHHIDYCTC